MTLAKAADDDGSWITIDGTHVHLNAQGVADKGPKALVHPAHAPRLSTNEHYAIDHFVTPSDSQTGFLHLNAALRSGKELSGDQQKQVSRLDSAIGKLPTYEGRTYRGVRFNSAEEKAQFIAAHQPGAKVEYKQYTSTSKNPSVASGDVRIVVEGRSGRDISGRSQDKPEQEVLYPRGSQFEVTRVANDSSGRTIIGMREVAAKMAKADSPKKKELEGIIELNLDWADLVPEVSPMLEAEAEAAAEDVMLSINIPEFIAGEANPIWTQVLGKAQKIAHERAAQLVGKRVLKDGTIVDNPNAEWSITDTTRDNLRELVDQAIENGWTNTQLQKEILQSTDFAPSRALNISRTEKAYARSHGTHAAAKETGMKFKDWLPDADACDICLANAEQGRIPIDEDFESGDDCVPAHPSDRCANGYYETSDGD